MQVRMNLQFWLCTQMCNHWRNLFRDAINDFMMGKHSCLLTAFWTNVCMTITPTPRLFCSLFTKSLQTNVLFQWFLPLRLISYACFFFVLNCKNVIVAGVSYLTWNSPSISLFANKHDNANNKKWQQEVIFFCWQKVSSVKMSKEQIRWGNA